MQVFFTIKVDIAKKIFIGFIMQVKIIEDSINKFGSLPEVQRQLIRVGVNISHTALYNAYQKKTKTLRFDVLSALVELTYDGDWSKAGKAIKKDVNDKD